jgi:hypothetical protein
MFNPAKYVFLAGLIAGSSAAVAGDLPPEILDNVMQSCRPDYHRLCSDVLPGDGRVGRCLLDNEAQLNPGCLKAIKFAYAIEVCMPDYRRFCNGVRPGGGQIVECLGERIESLNSECRRVVMANLPYSSPRRDYSYYNGYERYSREERFNGEHYRDAPPPPPPPYDSDRDDGPDEDGDPIK